MTAKVGSVLETQRPGLLRMFIELSAQRHVRQSTLRAGHTLSLTRAPGREPSLTAAPGPRANRKLWYPPSGHGPAAQLETGGKNGTRRGQQSPAAGP